MARPTQDAIETFMSITGASEAVAIRKLQEHGGDLNEAVNAHFSEGDRINVQPSPVPPPQGDFMGVDDPIDVQLPRSTNSLLSAARSYNPFSLLDPNFGPSFFEGGGAGNFSTHEPWVSYPREVREIPIEFKDENTASGSSGQQPTIEDVTGSMTAHGPEIHGTVIVDDDEVEDDDPSRAPAGHGTSPVETKDDSADVSFSRHPEPSVAPLLNEINYHIDIEEEMLQAAIQASRQEAEERSSKLFNVTTIGEESSALDDVELARAVSLSLKTAEQERALREKGKPIGEKGSSNSSDMEVEEVGSAIMANGRQEFATVEAGNSSQWVLEGNLSAQEEAEDVEEQPLVRRRSRSFGSGNAESAEFGHLDGSPPSSSQQHDVGSHPQHKNDVFQSAEWGGISSEEHDEALMLEAAIFGGIPEGTAYPFALPAGSASSNATMYPRVPHPPSPTLTEQRLLREQQDGEYLASLQADREKELKAMQEAELRRLEEVAARDAALQRERCQEEENHRKLLEEEEFERRLAVKQVSLPQEPSLEDENAVTLLVRMPDGSRRGRRFLKSDKLQYLFDFIDIGRAVKPGTYRLVRPYPRRAFTDSECELSLSELGLTSKQEALYIELI